jgi:four helix bundle protein
MPRDPRKLDVFLRAHQLVLSVYRATSTLPPEERFGLQAQLRRAAVSVPANLAEGCARRRARDYQRFVEIARGSAVELRYLLELTMDLGLADREALTECETCSDHVVRALHNLQRALGAFAE